MPSTAGIHHGERGVPPPPGATNSLNCASPSFGPCHYQLEGRHQRIPKLAARQSDGGCDLDTYLSEKLSGNGREDHAGDGARARRAVRLPMSLALRSMPPHTGASQGRDAHHHRTTDDMRPGGCPFRPGHSAWDSNPHMRARCRFNARVLMSSGVLSTSPVEAKAGLPRFA